MSLSKSVRLTHAQALVICEACENEVPGEYYCTECKQTLCLQCEELHRKSNTVHNIVHRSKKGSVDTTTLRCANNGDQATVHVAENVEAENQSLHKRPERIHHEGMGSLNSNYQSKSLMIDGCSAEIKKKTELCEKRKSDYQVVLGENSILAPINFVPTLEPLPKIESKPERPESPSFVPGNKQKAENMGKLQPSNPSLVVQPLKLTRPKISSMFKCPLEGRSSICITNGGDVWLGADRSRELVMVDIRGRVLKKRSVKNRTHALAVMDCGDIIISPYYSDSKSVSRLPENGDEQHVFDTSPSKSAGVSVTADQSILICTVDGRVVRAYRDSTNVIQLYKGLGDSSAVYAVEYIDGNIYISDRKTPAIVIVSKNGEVLSRITHTTRRQRLGGPLGLVVDNMDNILCAETCEDEDNQFVYIIDQNQKMRKFLRRYNGIQHPRHLAVDSDNNLWITQLGGYVNVFQYLA